MAPVEEWRESFESEAETALGSAVKSHSLLVAAVVGFAKSAVGCPSALGVEDSPIAAIAIADRGARKSAQILADCSLAQAAETIAFCADLPIVVAAAVEYGGKQRQAARESVLQSVHSRAVEGRTGCLAALVPRWRNSSSTSRNRS